MPKHDESLFADINKKFLLTFNISFIWIDHVSFNLMLSNIDIISADISIFDDIAIFVMSF